MRAFKLRRNTGGSALRAVDSDGLRALDSLLYTVTLVITSTFNPTLSPLSLINRLINNLINSEFLINSSKNIDQSTVLSSLILTQSLRFLTLSILNNFSASISRLNSVSKDLGSAFTAIFLKQAQISLQTASNAVTLTLQKALSINRSFANTFNLTLAFIPLKGVNVGMTFSINFSKLLEVSRGAFSVFNSNLAISRLFTTLLEISSLFNSQLFTQYTRFVSLAIDSTFSVSFHRISSFLLTIPDVLDGGNQGSFGGLLDGGDESSSYDYTYDGSNQDLEYFITGTQKNVQRSFSISSTFLSVIDTLFTPGPGGFINYPLAMEVLQTFSNSFAKLIATSSNIDNTLSGSVQRLASQAFTITSSFTSSFVSSSFRNIAATLESSLNLVKNASKTLSATLDTSLDIARIAAYWLSLAVVNTFSSLFNINVGKFFSLSSSNSVSFQKLILTSIELVLSIVINLFTQSLRFISLAVLSTFSVVRSLIATSSLDLAQTLDNSIQKVVAATRSLSSTATPLIQSAVSKTITSTLTSAINTVKLPNINLNPNFSTTFAVGKEVGKTISNGFTALTAITTFVAHWVSLATINTFGVSLTKLPYKFINASFEGQLSFQKSLAKLVELSAYSTLSLLTQTARFVSLSIVSAFNLSSNISVGKATNLAETLNSAFQRQISRTTALTASFTSAIKKVVTKSLLSSWTAQLDIDNVIAKMMSIDLNLSLTLVRQLSKSLSANVDTTLEMLRFVAYWLSLAIVDTFSSSLTKLPSKLIATSADNTVSYQRLITQAFNVTLLQTVNLLTQSLRFVSLNIISSYTVARNFAIDKTVSLSSSLTAAYQASITRLFTITQDLTAQFTRSVAKSFNLTEIASLNFSRLTSSNINVTVDASTTFIRQVAKNLTLSLNTTVDVLRIVAYWLSMAVVDTFETLLVKLPNKFLTINLDLSPNLTRKIFKVISTTTNSVINLLTQTLRFVSLSLLSSFGLMKTVNVDATTSVTEELISAFQRQSSRALTLSQVLTTAVNKNITNLMLSSWTAQLNVGKLISNNLTLNLDSSLVFVRQLAQSISLNVYLTVDMLRFVAYWFSMALINSFTTSVAKMPLKTVNVSSITSLSTSKVVGLKIRYNMYQSLMMLLQPTLYLTSSMINEFAVSTRLNINKLVAVNEILSTNLARSVARTLNLTTEFVISINRFVTQTLAPTFNQTVVISRAIARNFNLSTTLDSVVRKTVSSLLSLTAQTAVDIARFVAYWFSMAIVDNFDTSQQSRAGKSVTADLSGGISFTRAITQAFNLALTASSLVLTQTLRFISLSIVDNFNTSVAPTISKLIASTTELTGAFSSQVRKTINLSLDNSASLINSVTSTLSASITGVATFSKSIGFSLSRTVSFGLDTARFMTRTLSSTVTLSAEMARFVAYWLSMAITNIFDAAIVKRTNKLVTASVSSEINFQRSITNALNLLLTASMNIFTQTLRFISLAILNNFNTALTPVINKFVNTSVEFGAQTRNQVNTSIALTLTGGTEFAKNIFKAFNLSSSNLIAFSNLIAVNIDKALTLDSSVIKHVSKTLAASLSLPVDIARFVAHWLSLAIINVFDSSIVKLPNKLISADPINTVVYQKSINAFINQVLIASTNIFTQTLRFVSLAIVSGFEVTRSVLVQFAVQLSQTFSINFNRVINTLIAINSTFATQLNRGYFKLVSAVLEPSLSVTKQIGSFMVSSWNSQASISRQSSTRLETSFSGSTNFARYMVYLVTTGISFTFNIQTFVNKTISSVNTYSVQYQNNIAKFVSGAFTTTTNIATQSFRYVSLAITSSFSPILNRLTSFLVAINFSSSLILFRANAKLLALDLSVSVSIQRLTSIIVSLRLQSLFEAIVQKTLLRTIAYTFEKYIFDNTMQGGSSETSTFEEIVDGSAGSGIVEGNPRLIAVLARTIGKEQIVTLNIAVNLLKVISMNVRFAIVNLFETSLIKSVQHTVLASIDFSTNFQRSINVALRHVFSLTTSLLTQSLRFISLTILDQFQTNFGIAVSKGINNSFTLTAEWTKNTLKNLTALSENTVVLVRLPNKLLTLGSEFITSSTSIISKYLQNVSTFVAQLSTQSLRFITLALINSFASERKVLTSPFYNVDTEVTASNRNTVGKLISSSTGSEINFSRIVASSVLTTMTTAIEFARFIAISINFVLTASTLLGTQSLRFISLAIVNIFEVARTNLIGITRATTVEIIVNLRFTKNFMKLLEAATTLATRRSHTLYGTLTTFAVDKSQPGSEGSGQATQRKTGGNARKRTTKNEGSSFFRRGETDDLD